MEFSNIVRSEAELRALMGGPIAPPVVDKTLSSLDNGTGIAMGIRIPAA